VEAMTRLLTHARDARLGDWRGVVDARSVVSWPPVEPPPSSGGDAELLRGRGVRVVWPHRWEHDKGPDELLSIAERWSDELDLRWIVLGESFDATPPALEAFRERFAPRIDHFGREPDRAAYWRRLQEADWVLSTARHEFFGVAVVEALLAGCLPWLPQRLSYPELLPPQAQGLGPMSPPDDPDAVRRAVRTHLEPALAPNAVDRLDTLLEQCA
ncbi:MAG: glycosyltransferase family protein, partial [Planctomycetota bacterium]